MIIALVHEIGVGEAIPDKILLEQAYQARLDPGRAVWVASGNSHAATGASRRLADDSLQKQRTPRPVVAASAALLICCRPTAAGGPGLSALALTGAARRWISSFRQKCGSWAGSCGGSWRGRCIGPSRCSIARWPE